MGLPGVWISVLCAVAHPLFGGVFRICKFLDPDLRLVIGVD
jgi:hypothetical protein